MVNVYIFRPVMLLQPKTRIIIFGNNSPNAMQFNAMYHRCNLSLWYWIINTHYSTCGCNWIFIQQLLMFSMLSKHGQKRKRRKKRKKIEKITRITNACVNEKRSTVHKQVIRANQFRLKTRNHFLLELISNLCQSFRIYQRLTDDSLKTIHIQKYIRHRLFTVRSGFNKMLQNIHGFKWFLCLFWCNNSKELKTSSSEISM